MPALDPARWPPAVARTRALVLAHGWNATAYQLVNPGLERWFAAAGDAVVGYVRHARTWVVAGAPVCPGERLPTVVAEFEAAARGAGARACYFGAEARLEGTLRGSRGHARLALGAQPVWHPAALAATLTGHASLRAQLHRARNKGVVVAEEGTAGADPGVRQVLAEWLAARGLPPLHFLVEPSTLDRLDDRRVFVARRDGAVVGFTVLSPVPARQGWLVEQFVRGRGAPNGTIEALLAAAARAADDAGSGYLTLGLAPLSHRGAPPPAAGTPLWLGALLGWVRAHGRRFYDFDGLDAFKAKFRPERWDPVYAIAAVRRPGAPFPPRALWAIAAAFGGGSPVALGVRALARAGAAEVRWAVRGRTG
jgi:phosphatidylglycerol lysyltransferase